VLSVKVYVVNTLENHYLSRSVKKTDKEERDLRRLVSKRHSLVKSVTRVMNRTGHLLSNYEIKFSRRALSAAKRWQQLHDRFFQN
jgi:hypothetical protein